MIKALGVSTPCAIALPVALSIALTLAMPSSAADSDSDSGFYVEYSGGATFVPNQSITGADASALSFDGRAESDVGFNVGGAIGARFYKYFRGEVQFTYRQNEVSSMPIRYQDEVQRSPASGHIGLMTVMANGYVDYDLGIGVVPYLGVGMGWGRMELDAKNRSDFDGPDQTSIEGDDSVFTWSLMVGGSYPVNEVLDISLGYRYIATTDADVNSTITNIGEGVSLIPPLDDPDTSVARRLEAEYDAHEVVLGVRVNF
jgi:OOP family OmpA-OmpF porin